MINNSFHIFAYGAQGSGVSGGDRIFIELARRINSSSRVHIWLSEEGKLMCGRLGLSKNVKFHVSKVSKFRVFGSLIYNIILVLESLRIGLFQQTERNVFIYSASEFWMDSLPAFLWKLREKNVCWIASWYQTAPSPLKGFSLGSAPRNRLAAVPYWLFQKISKPYISRFADFVTVNNKSEMKEFPEHTKHNKVFVMYGAVDVLSIQKFSQKIGKLHKKFDAVFQGRFHPQKGVLELLDIWKVVTKRWPLAMLAMIGDGPLMTNVKNKIENLGLQNNVILLGYVFDGVEKYKTFMQSKVVVHPAFYDSGGMASAEAMAFGLPCVGFDLPSYKDYYPKGMLKVPQEDIEAFAKTIIILLEDKDLYKKTSNGARKMIINKWSWNTRVDDFWAFVTRTKFR